MITIFISNRPKSNPFPKKQFSAQKVPTSRKLSTQTQFISYKNVCHNQKRISLDRVLPCCPIDPWGRPRLPSGAEPGRRQVGPGKRRCGEPYGRRYPGSVGAGVQKLLNPFHVALVGQVHEPDPGVDGLLGRLLRRVLPPVRLQRGLLAESEPRRFLMGLGLGLDLH
ncbi:LOW QUALITY PROTEIN: hypothetical protein TorRG33x02_135040 [Trema orientale]|uniref:Uncharacterized protein n=1 Tax=Trema orientale TaxID=63057 RepID=A0A2P5EYN0_TREOI|nr:LOW QUALITY PROTEIN: hypothetical protein TorRG33x02_135040 [Trema orientale]